MFYNFKEDHTKEDVTNKSPGNEIPKFYNFFNHEMVRCYSCNIFIVLNQFLEFIGLGADFKRGWTPGLSCSTTRKIWQAAQQM